MAEQELGKDPLSGQNTVVVKIYNPYGDLVGGKFNIVQDKIDKAIGNQNWELVMFGENSSTTQNPYIQYASNDHGPTPVSQLKKTFLIEYYVEVPSKSMNIVRSIHKVILNELEDDFLIKYMISGADMHSLDDIKKDYV